MASIHALGDVHETAVSSHNCDSCPSDHLCAGLRCAAGFSAVRATTLRLSRVRFRWAGIRITGLRRCGITGLRLTGFRRTGLSRIRIRRLWFAGLGWTEFRIPGLVLDKTSQTQERQLEPGFWHRQFGAGLRHR